MSVYGDGQMNKFEPVQGQRGPCRMRAGVGVEGGGARLGERSCWRPYMVGSGHMGTPPVNRQND